MPQNKPQPTPVQGWFIPSQTTAPGTPGKLPLLLRLALIAAALTAIVLASHNNTDGQATTPTQTPAATTTQATPGTGTP
ncbi:hypothetical protein [Streptomyces prunicolor]